MKTRFLRDERGKIDKRYTIAEDGSYIRDKKTGKKLKPYIDSNGYRVVTITLNGKHYNAIKICRLQWLALRWIIPKRYDIHHKDFNKLNDHKNNINCIPRSKHMKIHNSGKNNPMYGSSGENSPSAKLTWLKVEEIRHLRFIKKMKCKRIADKFGISVPCIYHVINGYNWNPNGLTKEQLIQQVIKE